MSQNTGIAADEYPFLAKIDKRIEAITGLSTDSSEGHQVANYGIGGHYEPHLDFTSKFGDAPLESWSKDGNRIATLVFYVCNLCVIRLDFNVINLCFKVDRRIKRRCDCISVFER